MTRYSPPELKQQLDSGLACFPVTHATAELAFDEKSYVEHLEFLAGYRPAAMTAPGGTGEFFSLTLAEVSHVLRTAVSVAPEHSAVLGAAGYGTATAIEMARDAQAAGADGLFLLPPYLTELDQRGLVEHVKRVCAATDLGVLVYHRDRARFTAASVAELADSCPNFVAFKDGIGDIDLISTLASTVGDRLTYIDGMPTAEINAAAYLSVGCSTYSSAVFNFLPEWAMDVYTALRRGDQERVRRQLGGFLVPFLAIRDRRAGYAVSIVKAGMTAVGRTAGPVRPPLVDLLQDDLDELSELVARVA
jgi:5-dehydro-4-deoxyglucarate dehydratase